MYRSQLTGIVKLSSGKVPIPQNSSELSVEVRKDCSKKKAHLQRSREGEIEDKFEQDPQVLKWGTKLLNKDDEGRLHYLLPLKGKKGLIEQRPVLLQGIVHCRTAQ